MSIDSSTLDTVININSESIGKEYPYEEIEYIDISSVGEGILTNSTMLKLNEAPSRAKRIVKGGDTIISTVRPRNRSFYFFKAVSDNLIVSTGFAVLRPKSNEIDKRYLYYIISNPSFTAYLASHEKGAAYPAVNPAIIGKKLIQLPPLPTQHKIASILSAYDDLIENNTKRIKLLEEAAQNIYKEWFVHFRFPGYEKAKFKDGLPVGWDYKPLIESCDLTMGQSPASEFYNTNKEGLPFHQGVTNYGYRFVTHETYCTKTTKIAESGDILCSVRAPVGRLNITMDKIILGRGLSAIRNKNGFQSFQYYQLKNHFHTEDMIGNGAIFNAITKKVLEAQEILDPAIDIVEKYEEVANPIDTQIKTLHNQNQQLKEARDILLPRLMNRTIEVSADVEEGVLV